MRTPQGIGGLAFADQMTHQLLQRCGVIFRWVSVYRKDPRSADDVSSRTSAIGTKQTLMPTMSMSASGGKADIPDTPHQCPLLTQSGHSDECVTREMPRSAIGNSCQSPT